MEGPCRFGDDVVEGERGVGGDQRTSAAPRVEQSKRAEGSRGEQRWDSMEGWKNRTQNGWPIMWLPRGEGYDALNLQIVIRFKPFPALFGFFFFASLVHRALTGQWLIRTPSPPPLVGFPCAGLEA